MDMENIINKLQDAFSFSSDKGILSDEAIKKQVIHALYLAAYAGSNQASAEMISPALRLEMEEDGFLFETITSIHGDAFLYVSFPKP